MTDQAFLKQVKNKHANYSRKRNGLMSKEDLFVSLDDITEDESCPGPPVSVS